MSFLSVYLISLRCRSQCEIVTPFEFAVWTLNFDIIIGCLGKLQLQMLNAKSFGMSQMKNLEFLLT